MEVYDQVYQLARALKESQAVSDYQRAKDNLDPQSKEMLKNFRKCQFGIQKKYMAGQQPDELELKRLEHISSLIGGHPSLKQVLEAEYRLSMLLGDIQKVIAGTMEDVFKDELEDFNSTTTGNL